VTAGPEITPTTTTTTTSLYGWNPPPPYEGHDASPYGVPYHHGYGWPPYFYPLPWPLYPYPLPLPKYGYGYGQEGLYENEKSRTDQNRHTKWQVLSDFISKVILIVL